MRIMDLLLMSITNLFKRKVRTFLTVLGVVIGTTSIVVMVSLGIGLKAGILKDIENYGSLTSITVEKNMNYDAKDDKDKKEKFLDQNLIDELKQMEHVKDVSPRLTIDVLVKTGIYLSYIQLTGISEKEIMDKKFRYAAGGNPESDKEVELIIGNSVPSSFMIEKTGVYPYYDTNTPPKIDFMKDRISLVYNPDAYYNSNNNQGETKTGTTPKKPKKYQTKVAGVLEGNIDDWSRDSYSIYCNINALENTLKKEFKKSVIPGQPTTKSGKPYKDIYYTQLIVGVDKMENVKDLSQTINDMGYSASNDAEWIESEMNQMNYIQAVLGAIGAVSLLVAAIGITNTMMMSIYERTKEIGVMKVLGCDIRNIQEMFLFEAGFIGFIGGTAGIVLSYGLSFIINQLVKNSGMGMEQLSLIPLWLPLPAIGFAILIGMIAGFLPSLRAMKLSPLAAIHSE